MADTGHVEVLVDTFTAGEPPTKYSYSYFKIPDAWEEEGPIKGATFYEVKTIPPLPKGSTGIFLARTATADFLRVQPTDYPDRALAAEVDYSLRKAKAYSLAKKGPMRLRGGFWVETSKVQEALEFTKNKRRTSQEPVWSLFGGSIPGLRIVSRDAGFAITDSATSTSSSSNEITSNTSNLSAKSRIGVFNAIAAYQHKSFVYQQQDPQRWTTSSPAASVEATDVGAVSYSVTTLDRLGENLDAIVVTFMMHNERWYAGEDVLFKLCCFPTEENERILRRDFIPADDNFLYLSTNRSGPNLEIIPQDSDRLLFNHGSTLRGICVPVALVFELWSKYACAEVQKLIQDMILELPAPHTLLGTVVSKFKRFITPQVSDRRLQQLAMQNCVKKGQYAHIVPRLTDEGVKKLQSYMNSDVKPSDPIFQDLVSAVESVMKFVPPRASRLENFLQVPTSGSQFFGIGLASAPHVTCSFRGCKTHLYSEEHARTHRAHVTGAHIGEIDSLIESGVFNLFTICFFNSVNAAYGKSPASEAWISITKRRTTKGSLLRTFTLEARSESMITDATVPWALFDHDRVGFPALDASFAANTFLPTSEQLVDISMARAYLFVLSLAPRGYIPQPTTDLVTSLPRIMDGLYHTPNFREGIAGPLLNIPASDPAASVLTSTVRLAFADAFQAAGSSHFFQVENLEARSDRTTTTDDGSRAGALLQVCPASIGTSLALDLPLPPGVGTGGYDRISFARYSIPRFKVTPAPGRAWVTYLYDAWMGPPVKWGDEEAVMARPYLVAQAHGFPNFHPDTNPLAIIKCVLDGVYSNNFLAITPQSHYVNSLQPTPRHPAGEANLIVLPSLPGSLFFDGRLPNSPRPPHLHAAGWAGLCILREEFLALMLHWEDGLLSWVVTEPDAVGVASALGVVGVQGQLSVVTVRIPQFVQQIRTEQLQEEVNRAQAVVNLNAGLGPILNAPNVAALNAALAHQLAWTNRPNAAIPTPNELIVFEGVWAKLDSQQIPRLLPARNNLM